MTITRITRTIGAVTLGLLAVTGLAACGNPAEDVAQNVAEQAVEEAMGGDVDITDDSMTMTDAEGNEMAVGESISVPDSWPADVPLFDGTLAMVTVQAEGGAYAMWTSDMSPQDAVDAYGAQLEASGYTLQQEASMAGTEVREYVSSTLMVSVVAGTAEGSTTLTVTAVPQ